MRHCRILADACPWCTADGVPDTSSLDFDEEARRGGVDGIRGSPQLFCRLTVVLLMLCRQIIVWTVWLAVVVRIQSQGEAEDWHGRCFGLQQRQRLLVLPTSRQSGLQRSLACRTRKSHDFSRSRQDSNTSAASRGEARICCCSTIRFWALR